MIRVHIHFYFPGFSQLYLFNKCIGGFSILKIFIFAETSEIIRIS